MEKAKAPHSSTLAWRVPWTAEPGGLQSLGSLGTTERLHFHFSLSCTGEGNGNPLQFSCLENPRDGGAWWAAVYGVAQSWTRPKRLSSSSNFSCAFLNNLCIYDCAGSRCYAGFTPVVMSGVWLECEGLSVCWLHVVEQDRSWALAVAVAAAPEP